MTEYYLETYSGIKFYYNDIKLEYINIVDIAHAIAMQARCNGHTERFYGIAEHCLNVSEIVPDYLKLPALLHDAAEAYVGDLVGPVKYQPGLERYREIEDRITGAIYKKFDITVSAEDRKIIKLADLRMLKTEGLQLFKYPKEWSLIAPDITPIEGFQILGLNWERAKEYYLDEFNRLMSLRTKI
jgi:5'-deoxynucleotidase YfbR-like HD superfamily hydrolase